MKESSLLIPWSERKMGPQRERGVGDELAALRPVHLLGLLDDLLDVAAEL